MNETAEEKERRKNLAAEMDGLEAEIEKLKENRSAYINALHIAEHYYKILSYLKNSKGTVQLPDNYKSQIIKTKDSL